MDNEVQPFIRGSETSEQAAVLIGPNAKTLEERVLRYLARCDDMGATDEEGQRSCFLDGDTYRPRRRRLEQIGMAEPKADGSQRKTTSGRFAVVHVATEAGRRWLQELDIQARNAKSK